MKTTNRIIILTLTILIVSCSSRTNKKEFEHNYVKYWDRYTEQQLIDTLFSDTLMVGPDTDGGRAPREFYINKIQELLTDLNNDKNKPERLYPMTDFDKLTIKKLPLGFKRIFTNEQVNKFLEIINDPISFEWGETTYEPKYRVDFLKDNKIVATLTIDEEKWIIKTELSWQDFKKMKFGALKSEPRNELIKLLQ
jgi:hypothetical protein